MTETINRAGPKWEAHTQAWRDPAGVIAGSERAGEVDRGLLRFRVRGRFWETLAEHALTVIVTREYEHLVIALSAPGPQGRPHPTHMSLPHPSGMAFDPGRGELHVAATRNPNQILTLAPLAGSRRRSDRPAPEMPGRPLMPVRTRFLPGCLYLHDLAMVGGALHGNAVGENAIVRFDEGGSPVRVWWPRSIEGKDGPDFTRNHLQLNSIAPGVDLPSSFFSASTERPGRYRPGHLKFPVDGRGVIFAADTREPLVRGLTRPHSARLHDGRVWVANSGYGELAVCEDGAHVPVTAFNGWTRGLCFAADLAFVGTSRVIPRYSHYAPGLRVDRSECGVHVVDTAHGEILGSIIWPEGNQIFAVEVVPTQVSWGFAQTSGGRPRRELLARLHYSFQTGEDAQRDE